MCALWIEVGTLLNRLFLSREWLIMLEDYCVKAESGQKIPPDDVNAMGDFLSAMSASVKKAEANVKRRA